MEKNELLHENVDFGYLAKMTKNYTGAEIGVDHFLRRINERCGHDALPLHSKGALEAIVK